jgi:hypothetical protein
VPNLGRSSKVIEETADDQDVFAAFQVNDGSRVGREVPGLDGAPLAVEVERLFGHDPPDGRRVRGA